MPLSSQGLLARNQQNSMLMIHPSKQELQSAYAVIKGVQVPHIPDIIAKLREELATPEPDSKKISDLVAQDPALSGEIIRLVNSPLYGGVSTISSVHQAVVRMGMDKVVNLVTAEIVKNAFGEMSSPVSRIWESILDEAKAAMSIARLVEGTEPDEAYLLSIMHDAGTLVLSSLHNEYSRIWDMNISAPVSVIQHERALFNTDHTVIGYLFAHHWKLPDPMPSAIYLHHQANCARIPDDRLRAMVALIKLASFLNTLPFRDMELPEMTQYRMAAQRELMIPPDNWDQLCQEAATGFA